MVERRALAVSNSTGPELDGPDDPSPLALEPTPIDRLLEQVAGTAAETSPARAASLQPARLALLRGLGWASADELEVSVSRSAGSLRANVARELDRELLNAAIRDGQLLLAEWPENDEPTVVGVVQTRPASKLRIAAEEIEIDASRELLLRSGSSALRMRSGGEVELVGSRISAVSRGVMRIIGRLLRLN